MRLGPNGETWLVPSIDADVFCAIDEAHVRKGGGFNWKSKDWDIEETILWTRRGECTTVHHVDGHGQEPISDPLSNMVVRLSQLGIHPVKRSRAEIERRMDIMRRDGNSPGDITAAWLRMRMGHVLDEVLLDMEEQK